MMQHAEYNLFIDRRKMSFRDLESIRDFTFSPRGEELDAIHEIILSMFVPTSSSVPLLPMKDSFTLRPIRARERERNGERTATTEQQELDGSSVYSMNHD